MTRRHGANDAPDAFADEEFAWIGEHVSELRPWLSDERFLRRSLWIAFVVGLTTHAGGYLLRSAVTAEPLLLVADLLYALGWSLWTGVVVAVFVQVIPEAKRRQLKRSLEAYDATVRDKARGQAPERGGD